MDGRATVLGETGYGDDGGTGDVAVGPGASRLVHVLGRLTGVLDGEKEGAVG
jgi:hypothetical protein